MIYPQPFGKVTSGSEKDYPIDFSHFNIQGTCVGAVGVEADPDVATFPAVDCSTAVGRDGSIKLDFPVFTGAVGSTEIARVNWEEMAIGAAISGIIVVAGENICGMDPQAEFKNGKISKSPEMERRIEAFKKWYDGKGGIIIQANVEDTKLGVPEYVIEKLGIEIFELKWGQGAKDIGGEVKLPSLERALESLNLRDTHVLVWLMKNLFIKLLNIFAALVQNMLLLKPALIVRPIWPELLSILQKLK
jgi:hypothetical protein